MSMEKTTTTPWTSDLKEALRELLNESVAVYAVVQTAFRGRGELQRSADIESRLGRSVMRPLKDALRRLGDTETRPDEAVALAAPGLVPTDLGVVMVGEDVSPWRNRRRNCAFG